MTYLWSKGEAITVQSDALATPLVFNCQGRNHPVQQIAIRWRVDQGWWRKRIWKQEVAANALLDPDPALGDSGRAWSQTGRDAELVYPLPGPAGHPRRAGVWPVVPVLPGRPVPDRAVSPGSRPSRLPSFDRLPRGAVIAVCQLTDVWQITATTVPPEPERSFGNYTPGRWAWRLEEITPLAKPIPAVGAWGLWSPPADLISFLGQVQINGSKGWQGDDKKS